MAHDEMRMIKEPDSMFLKEKSSNLWLYYAETDNWVGKERESIISLLGEGAIRLRCNHGVPHSFCIRKPRFL